MAISKRVRRILKVLSANEIEVKTSRRLANLKAITSGKVFHKTFDSKVLNGDHIVPVRAYFPKEPGFKDKKILLFFHGGGWATESIDTYERACVILAQDTGCIVVSVEYRLAPEYKFPTALEDCYAAAKALYCGRLIKGYDQNKITIIGDSAGGNLAAAVSLLARDRKEFYPRRQILIYPAVYGDYDNPGAPYPSLFENGNDYILTLGKIKDYVNLYARNEEDKKNKYFAPIREKDLFLQPDTLVITAEFDPLRDEGEAYGMALKNAGNWVEVLRIKDAIHGFFALGVRSNHMQMCIERINRFLEEEQEIV